MTRRRMNPGQSNPPAPGPGAANGTPEGNSAPNGGGNSHPANGTAGVSNGARRGGRPRGRRNGANNNPRQPRSPQDSQQAGKPRRNFPANQESQPSAKPRRAPKPGQGSQPQPAKSRHAPRTGQENQQAAKPRPTNRGGQNGRKNQNRSSRDDRGNVFAPSIPRQARGGIKARSATGEFGKNWWAKRWLSAMERLMDGARLQRGRRYARMGQVLSMNEVNGGITARVQGSRPQPYKVTIRIESFSDEQWEKVLDVLAAQALYTAQLLAGEMPPTIEDAFAAADVSLFPARGGDLMTECSCPDWANPCKHIAATHYILGDRFDEDPFLILRMRGRTQEEILQSLRQRRAGQAEVEEELPPEPEAVKLLEEEDLAHFWEIGPGLENFSVNIQRPPIPLPMLKRLGEPDFARQHPLEDNLGPAYEAASQAALILAYSDISAPPPENGENA